jgi:rod shape determining protein RodA
LKPKSEKSRFERKNMNSKQLRNVEWSMLICTIILVAIGLFALFSASKATELEDFKKQIMWAVVSIPILLITMFIDYKIIAKLSIGFYILSIILLIVVLLTSAVNGATSWFSLGPISIQPAEFAKIAVVLFLANVMSKMSRTEINKPLKLLMLIGIIIVPVVLIVLQPDYGTAMAYIFATAIMLYVAGINKRYIILTLLILIISLPLLYFFVLPEHAKLRIDVYLNPYLDPRGAGYNIIQSKLAIGAGRLVGQGWMNGTQTHLGFLYPKTTDFIFAVIGEEMGFITCAGIIIMYIVLITRSITVAKNARDDLGSYIAAGIVRNTAFPRFRKYRNDNGTITYHRCAPSIYKLWRKLNAYKYDSNRTIAKYKLSTSKINV